MTPTQTHAETGAPVLAVSVHLTIGIGAEKSGASAPARSGEEAASDRLRPDLFAALGRLKEAFEKANGVRMSA